MPKLLMTLLPQQAILEYLADHCVLSVLTVTSWCLHIPGLNSNLSSNILGCAEWIAWSRAPHLHVIHTLTINEAVDT